MCDYSLTNVVSRPAKVGDKLVTRDFGTGTRGFAPEGSDDRTAVCVLPGTELAFASDVEIVSTGISLWRSKVLPHRLARFRQINKERVAAHHDALEFPDGTVVLLTYVTDGQSATVLQLPAAPRNEKEVEDQKRVAHVG
jgi:hypothetical protein